MNIKELTDDELSLEIGKAVLPEHEFRDWTDASWDEFMPLALEYDVVVSQKNTRFGFDFTGFYFAISRHYERNAYVEHTNPLRALKECLLLVLKED